MDKFELINSQYRNGFFEPKKGIAGLKCPKGVLVFRLQNELKIYTNVEINFEGCTDTVSCINRICEVIDELTDGQRVSFGILDIHKLDDYMGRLNPADIKVVNLNRKEAEDKYNTYRGMVLSFNNL